MRADDEAPVVPSALLSDAIELSDSLDEAALQAVIDYAQARRQYIHPDITDQIKPAPNEEIVRVEEQRGYVELVKYPPYAEGCDKCPHGPFLYYVQEEQQLEEGTSLHWSYIGPTNG